MASIRDKGQTMQRKVILLFGGESQERFVSVATAQNLSRFLPNALCWFWAPNDAVYEVDAAFLQEHKDPFNAAFEPQIPVLFETLPSALDCPDYKGHIFLLGLHGGRGEDGTVQKWLEDRDLTFTGSHSEACGKAFDKVWAKSVLADFPIKMAPTLVVRGNDKLSLEALRTLFETHSKVVVKPVHDGSSVGLCIIESDRALQAALDMVCSQLDRPFIAEPFIAGTELTVGVVDEAHGPRALPATEIRAQAGRTFDYNGKYLGHGVQEITPAEVSAEWVKKAQEMAVLAHKALGCVGYSRTDLIMHEGEAYFLETNTLPGLTRASLVPQQLAAEGTTLTSFLEHVLDMAEKHREQK
nr:D-ala D-ala ligase C-terminus [uncultured bacterium]